MKWPILLLALAATGAQAQAELPAFEFRGFVAGETVSPERLEGCYKGRDYISCGTAEDKLAGRPARVSIVFYERRLTSVSVHMKRDTLPAVFAALAEKYGKPCRSEIETKRNRLGIELKGAVEVWCFRTGELKLREMGVGTDYLHLDYEDQFQRPTAPPAVDF